MATETIRARAQEVDKHVGLRIRERRLMLGLRQQQMAKQIDVCSQQVHKYENGMDRITAGRLAEVAEALAVEVSYFFQGMDAGETFQSTSHERTMLDLAQSFISMPNRHHQEAICVLARAMAGAEQA